MRQREEESPAYQGQKSLEEPRERIGLGYLRIPKSLGSSGYAAKPEWIKTIQGGAEKHKEHEQTCPYQPPNYIGKKSEGLGTSNS